MSMSRKLCAGLLCLVMAGLGGSGHEKIERSAEEFTELVYEEKIWPVAETPEHIAKSEEITELKKLSVASVKKIDLSVPESQEYRDWLEVYYAQPWFGYTERVPGERPQPDNVKRSGQKKWITWSWNDEWELELYINGEYGKYEEQQKLCARERATGKTHVIGAIENSDFLSDSWIDFEVIHVDPTYMVYGVGGGFVSQRVYLCSLERREKRFIGYAGDSSGFLDEERTKWWHREHAGGSYPLYYTDLWKLAAGDPDAQREVICDGLYCCFDGWMAEGNGHSVACFRVATRHAESGGYDVPCYIVVYDLLNNKIQGIMELPSLTVWDSPVPVFPNICYYFDTGQAYSYFVNGEELDLSTIDFYVINLDI